MFGTNPGLNKKDYVAKLDGIYSLFYSVMDAYVPEKRKKDYFHRVLEDQISKIGKLNKSSVDQDLKLMIDAYAYTLRSILFSELSLENNVDTGIELAKKMAPFNKHQSAATLTELAMAVIYQDRYSSKNAEKAQSLVDLSLQLYPKGKTEFDTVARVEALIASLPSQSSSLQL